MVARSGSRAHAESLKNAFFRSGKDFRRVNSLTVKDIMHVKENVPLVTAPTPMPDLLNIMTEKGFGVAGIVVKGRLAGVVSDESLRRRMRSGKKPGEIAP